jgi:hypothetical protein
MTLPSPLAYTEQKLINKIKPLVKGPDGIAEIDGYIVTWTPFKDKVEVTLRTKRGRMEAQWVQ